MIALLVAGALVAIAAPFLLYPGALWLRARLRPVAVAAADIEPPVTLVICAHDEAASIEARLRNALALDYPAERLSIVVASDGSSDDTVAIARRFEDERVRVLDLPRGGKAAALAAAVAVAKGDVLAFSDANSEWPPDALRRLVRPFADERVGGVAGDQRYRSAETGGAAAGERSYWSFDRWQKAWQSRAGSVVSATGAIYAVRRALFEAPPADATDDFMISTGVVAAGRRLVFEPTAVAWEPPADDQTREFRRKVRVISRGLRAVWYRRALLDPRRTGSYALLLLLHKVWRRLTWIPALTLVVLAPFAWNGGGLAALVTGATAGLAGVGAMGLALPRLRGVPPFSLAAYVLMVQAACALATWNFVTGRRVARWDSLRPVDGSGSAAG